MENPTKMDDLGGPLFQETNISTYIYICIYVYMYKSIYVYMLHFRNPNTILLSINLATGVLLSLTYIYPSNITKSYMENTWNSDGFASYQGMDWVFYIRAVAAGNSLSPWWGCGWLVDGKAHAPTQDVSFILNGIWMGSSSNIAHCQWLYMEDTCHIYLPQ